MIAVITGIVCAVLAAAAAYAFTTASRISAEEANPRVRSRSLPSS
jgi:hypothetical protein